MGPGRVLNWGREVGGHWGGSWTWNPVFLLCPVSHICPGMLQSSHQHCTLWQYTYHLLYPESFMTQMPPVHFCLSISPSICLSTTHQRETNESHSCPPLPRSLLSRTHQMQTRGLQVWVVSDLCHGRSTLNTVGSYRHGVAPSARGSARPTPPYYS